MWFDHFDLELFERKQKLEPKFWSKEIKGNVSFYGWERKSLIVLLEVNWILLVLPKVGV